MIKPAERIEWPKIIIFKPNPFLITRKMIWLPNKLMAGIECTDILTGNKCTKKTLPSPLGGPMHRGAFCQSSFQWIYYYSNNKLTRKETHKSHLSAMSHKSIKMQRKPMPQCPCLKIYTLEWNSFHQLSKLIQRSCNSLKGHNIHLSVTLFWLSKQCSKVHQNKLMTNLIWTQPIQKLHIRFLIPSSYLLSCTTFQSH